MARTLMVGFIVAELFLGQAGCKSSGTCPQPGPPPGPILVPGPGPVLAPAPMPRSTPWLPEPPIAPAPMDSQSKSIDPYVYQKDVAWTQGLLAPSVRLYPPEAIESSGGDKRVQLRPPEVSDSENPGISRAEAGSTTKEPPLLPVGISQFTQVRPKVANGLRPTLDDGLGWLKTNGYKTVLYLHAPGSPDSADRQQVEKRGMSFIAMEVSSVTLSQKIIDEFNRIVGDSAGLPLFVYDTDGSLTGGLWYVHFRLTQGASDDEARKHARRLGLRENGDGSHREMWQAAQKFMSERQP
jgi:protein tyrosine phosphatase (PTP) superfamily phosphohydrolase (DUF442 family)